MTTRLHGGVLAVAVLLAGCAQTDSADQQQSVADEAAGPQTAGPQQEWWDNMQQLCGNAYAGEMTRYNPEMDQGWLNRPVIMHVRECTPTEIRIPLHVGENRSRTWVLTRTADGIRLKHDHRHPDGTEEASTQYGGDTVAEGTANRQEFPADDYSKALFEEQDHPDGVHNVWTMEVHPGERFSYNLSRFNRDFQADFDLTAPVDAPPPPWVVEPQG
jgi:hypothetical protein